jgi:hypothetical protein
MLLDAFSGNKVDDLVLITADSDQCGSVKPFAYSARNILVVLLTKPLKTGPRNMSSPKPRKRAANERQARQRRADHRDPEARRSRIEDDGVMRAAGDHAADLLPLERLSTAGWRVATRRREATGGGEPGTEAGSSNLMNQSHIKNSVMVTWG